MSSAAPCSLVTLNGEAQGKTPIVVNLRRKDVNVVSIELEGYEPYEITLRRSLNGWVFGNIAVGGAIGLGIDAWSGDLFKLTPTQVSAEFKKRGISLGDMDNTLCVAVVTDIDPDWKKIDSLKRETYNRGE